MVNVTLTCFVSNEIPQVADFCLADPMDSPKPLLDTIWIPRQIVVHHQVSTLEVDSFAGSIRREKNLNLGVVPERFLRIHPVFTAHPTMNHNDAPCPPQNSGNLPFKIVQRIAVFREDNQLLGRRRDNKRHLNEAMLTTCLARAACSKRVTHEDFA